MLSVRHLRCETIIGTTKKIIIDCDPGIDDAVAIVAAFAIPDIEVLAITAVEGCVDANRVTANLENIVEVIDPPKRPRLGAAGIADNATAVDTRYLHGDDGLGNVNLEGSTHLNRVSSDKLIVDLVRQHPGDVSVICLGPLTNISNALLREPSIATTIDRLFMVGGSLNGIGNITPTAEFNMYFDPQSARDVFKSAIAKTLIPLDVTSRVDFGLEFYNKVSKSNCPEFLKSSLQHLFQTYRQQLGRESILLNDAVGMVAALTPSYLETSDYAGDVECDGELTRGMTIFDRRSHREFRENMEVGTMLDADATRNLIERLIC